jgi:ABC-type lipoprotein export system ATPase subunit
MEERTEVLLRTFGIEDIKNKYPNELSGGQKQRVAIARALSNKPMILLADEPTGNLDSKSGKTVIDAFLDAKRTLGATILMVTHDAFAASHTDRVVALKDGQIVKELVRDAKSDEDFLNEILTFMKGING